MLGLPVAVADGEAAHGRAGRLCHEGQQDTWHARPGQQCCKQGRGAGVGLDGSQLAAQAIHDVVCVGCHQAL